MADSFGREATNTNLSVCGLKPISIFILFMLPQFPPSRNTRLATFLGMFSRFGTYKRAVTMKKRYPVKETGYRLFFV